MHHLDYPDHDNDTMSPGYIVLDSKRSPHVLLWLWLWLGRRCLRFQVTEHSMLPLLKPGDEVLVNRHAYDQQHPQPNDIIVLDHPQHPGFRLVKRVKQMPKEAIALPNLKYWVEGDNVTVSTDSRHFGPVPPHCLVGKVICIFRTTDP